MKKKFWHDGLYFKCHQCGNCCTFPNGVVYASKNEMLEISNFLSLSFDKFLENYTVIDDEFIAIKSKEDGPCVFYENHACAVYSVRPTQCRTYPFWPEILKNESRWLNESTKCAGINKDSFHTKEEIAEELKKNYSEKFRKDENS
jgi:Fe-S-cluster containining protein